jgi:hypothetical protein
MKMRSAIVAVGILASTVITVAAADARPVAHHTVVVRHPVAHHPIAHHPVMHHKIVRR